MSFVLALDQGTSSSRAIVFDERGRIAAMAQRELRQHFPQPGWVEHDPLEIRDDQLACAREAIARAGLEARDLAALGIANQRETTVVWERASGRPIHRAIVWQDRRTEPLCARLRESPAADEIRARTGLVIDPYFSGTKARWILDRVPGAHEAARRGELAFGTIDTWLLWQLTGGAVHATDPSNASRTMLFDLARGDWDDALCEAVGVPRAMLPVVRPSCHVHGETLPGLLGAPVRIAGVAGDQQAALFGQACFAPGMAKNTYGTGCFMLAHAGSSYRASAEGLVVTAAAQGADPEFAIEGSVFVGGAVVQWMRDGLRAIGKSSDIEALAASVPDAGGVVMVPAFTGLGAPYWKPDAQGAILGLSRGTTVAHIARAALESIAFQSAALLAAIGREAVAAGGAPIHELRVDGGASANDLLMQFQADLLGIPVVRPRITETTALGAAYLAGLTTGVWPDREALAAQWTADRTFHPTMARAQAEERMARWERAVGRIAD